MRRTLASIDKELIINNDNVITIQESYEVDKEELEKELRFTNRTLERLQFKRDKLMEEIQELEDYKTKLENASSLISKKEGGNVGGISGEINKTRT